MAFLPGWLMIRRGLLLLKARDELGLGDPGQDGGALYSLPLRNIPM